MGVNSLPKTVTGQRRGCDLKPGPSAPESNTLTTRLPSHPMCECANCRVVIAKFHNTDTDTDPNGPARTQRSFAAKKSVSVSV